MVKRLCVPIIAFLLSIIVAGTATAVDLKGRVVLEGTDQPLKGVVVGILRASELGDGPDNDVVNLERFAVTKEDGVFVIWAPNDVPCINKVFLAAGSNDHITEIYDDVPVRGTLPTRGDFRKAGLKLLDLTVANPEIVISLRPVSQPVRTEMVPMADGTKLATDVYLPTGDGPWPAVILRTPYGKGDFAPEMRVFTRAGYAAVAQDMRGRFDSEGKAAAFLDCGWGQNKDGYDTVEWIAAQKWCNGKVGTHGGSAMGITQNMMAGAKPPHLTCQFIMVAASNLYAQAVFRGGAYCQSLVDGWITETRFPKEDLALLRSHPCYDDFWKGLDSATRFAEMNVPAVHIGGWYDCFLQGTIDEFVGRQTLGAEGSRGKQKLLIGPWTHGGANRTKQGILEFPQNSVMSGLVADPILWFDYWLKGMNNGIDRESAVRYYVMGDTRTPGAPGNCWKTADSWPVPAADTPWYMTGQGTLAIDKPKENIAPSKYDFDPRKPVPTRGGQNLTISAGPHDQREIEGRPDVLLFTSDVLEAPLEVVGRIKVRLWASSSAKDTDFTARLTDVYPGGQSILVCDGIIRARHRDGMDRETLMEPGKIYEFEIDLWSTAIVFNKGHRIRLAISSSNSPRFSVNPNTGGPLFGAEEPVVANQCIYHDAEHPSCVTLPVVK
jgi:predicted acyl esterase